MFKSLYLQYLDTMNLQSLLSSEFLFFKSFYSYLAVSYQVFNVIHQLQTPELVGFNSRCTKAEERSNTISPFQCKSKQDCLLPTKDTLIY